MAYEFNEWQLKWLEALESGKYPQGHGRLADKGTYCCLGVAGLVCGLEEEEIEGGLILDGSDERATVVDRLLLRSPGGGLKTSFKVDRKDGPAFRAEMLTELNDEAKWDFQQIAKFIRENPELVFLP